MSTVIFGIKNCDTVKKARRWLDSQAIAYEFADFRESPPTLEQIHHWIDAVGLETIVNRRSTTYRQLTAEQQQSTDMDTWAHAIHAQPTLIKRPLLQHQDQFYCGFKEAQYKELFYV